MRKGTLSRAASSVWLGDGQGDPSHRGHYVPYADPIDAPTVDGIANDAAHGLREVDGPRPLVDDRLRMRLDEKLIA